MKLLKYVCFFCLAFVVLMNHSFLTAQMTSNEDSPKAPSQVRPPTTKKRTPATQDMIYTEMSDEMAAVIFALEENNPNGRSWESLPEDEFLIEVEEWTDQILEKAKLDISNPKLKEVGKMLFQFRDPYWKYLGYAMIVRHGSSDRAELEANFLLLSQNRHLYDCFESEEEMNAASPDKVVAHMLAKETVSRYGYYVLQSLNQGATDETVQESRLRLRDAIELLSEHETRYLMLAMERI